MEQKDSNLNPTQETSRVKKLASAAELRGSKSGKEGDGKGGKGKMWISLIVMVVVLALAVGVYQGAITLFGVFIADFMNDALILNLSGVGSVLIFAVGLNLIRPKTIKVGNLLPALLIPVFYELLKLVPFIPW